MPASTSSKITRRDFVGRGQHGTERQHRARQFAARRHPRQRLRLLAGIRGESELHAVAAARGDPTEAARSRATRKTPRSMPRIRISRSTNACSRRAATLPPRGQFGRRRHQLRLDLIHQSLLLDDDLVVPRQPLQLTAGCVAEGEHGRLAIAVLPLEPSEGIQPLLDRLQATGIFGGRGWRSARTARKVSSSSTLAESSVSAGAANAGSSRPRSRSPRAARRKPGKGRVAIVVELSFDLRQSVQDPLGVLQAPTLHPQLLLLTGPEAGRVELAHLKAQQVLPLCPIALDRPQSL